MVSSRAFICEKPSSGIDSFQPLVAVRTRSNENKMSDGGRERASVGVEVWKSSQKESVQRSAVRSIAWLDGSPQIIDKTMAHQLSSCRACERPRNIPVRRHCALDLP